MTAPLQRENLSCQPTTLGHRHDHTTISAPLQMYPTICAPLHCCHDMRPHSGTALYTEWISAQPPYRDCPASFQAIDQENPTGQLHIMPYIAFA